MQWWMDVLENGPSSHYAPYFDIDWQPLKTGLRDKVLLPILGDQYGRVLERGELKVRFEAGAFYLTYYEHEWPIAPGTYRHILQIALELLERQREEDFYAEFQSIMTALDYLPRRNAHDPARHRGADAGEGNHQTTARAPLRGSAAGARRDREGCPENQRHAR